MYIPQHFSVREREQALALIDQFGFAQMTSVIDGQMHCTHLAFIRDANTLYGHLALANPQAKAMLQGTAEVQVCFTGPHGYISPSWYVNAGVPTWNYAAVHVYGVPQVIPEPDRVQALLASLTAYYEQSLPAPWQPDYDARQLRAIVAFALPISRLDAKFKMSQNRPAEDRAGVLLALRQQRQTALADFMEAINEPEQQGNP